MKSILFIFTCLLFGFTEAQNQFFEFKPSKQLENIEYKVYRELKEQVDQERTLWETMKYSFVLKQISLEADTFSLQLCYDHDFISLFTDSNSLEFKQLEEAMCFTASFETKFSTFTLGHLDSLNYQLQSSKHLNDKALLLQDAFSIQEIIKSDISSLLVAFNDYEEENKMSKSETFLAKMYEIPSLFENQLTTEHLGVFNEQKHLRELHLKYDYMWRKPETQNRNIMTFEVNRSAHIAFNTKLNFLEIYQETMGYDFFYPEGEVYSLNHNFMISRVE